RAGRLARNPAAAGFCLSSPGRTEPPMTGLRRFLAVLVMTGTWAAQAAAQGDAQRGAYIAKAAGCLGCHTATTPGAVPYAGGRALRTPFGTFYGPNITPHPEAGIGRWSESDFI